MEPSRRFFLSPTWGSGGTYGISYALGFGRPRHALGHWVQTRPDCSPGPCDGSCDGPRRRGTGFRNKACARLWTHAGEAYPFGCFSDDDCLRHARFRYDRIAPSCGGMAVCGRSLLRARDTPEPGGAKNNGPDIGTGDVSLPNRRPGEGANGHLQLVLRLGPDSASMPAHQLSARECLRDGQPPVHAAVHHCRCGRRTGKVLRYQSMTGQIHRAGCQRGFGDMEHHSADVRTKGCLRPHTFSQTETWKAPEFGSDFARTMSTAPPFCGSTQSARKGSPARSVV
jgi:hypothetical protein